MNNIFLWGTGLSKIADKISPDQLCEVSAYWASASDTIGPWWPVSLIFEGEKSRCWKSGQSGNDKTLFITGPCSSSLDLAWHFHQIGILPEFGSVVALTQWAGRGRFGRIWHSSVGNVYGAWHLPRPDKAWSGLLSLVVGFIVLQGLKECGIPVQLKWPNDLVINGKKIGGILIEERNNAVIAGIGINLISSPGTHHLRDPRALCPTFLKEYGIEISPLEFWLKLIEHGESLYTKITHSEKHLDFSLMVQDHMAFVGHRIIVYDSDGSPYEAQLIGLDSFGRLQVSTPHGQSLIRSGSIYPITDSMSIT